MSPISIQAWAINESRTRMEELCSGLIHTGARHDMRIELLGVGEKFIEHKQRLKILKTFLETRDPDDIVVCIDGFDTLVNDSATALLEKFLELDTRILIGGEKRYTHQYSRFRQKFDEISSDYRYVNAGAFMGYAGDLLTMCKGMIHIDMQITANDQGLMGIWVSLLLEHPEWVRLDTNCDIFWVTTNDWQILENVAVAADVIVNPGTGTRPVIIHCVARGAAVSESSYNAAYSNIMRRPAFTAKA